VISLIKYLLTIFYCKIYDKKMADLFLYDLNSRVTFYLSMLP
jgi:hypothetical protein